ncbi:MAG: hypothetical protein K8S99_05235 [Planctomycetes bacterium]|nr:hypothetical protein [Planctomycetota bacterium]
MPRLFVSPSPGLRKTLAPATHFKSPRYQKSAGLFVARRPAYIGRIDTPEHQPAWLRPTITAYRGATPTLDGTLAPGEWDDATPITGVRGWFHQFKPVIDDRDLSLRGFVKHDGSHLYFAFDVTDDVLYGHTVERWLPTGFPRAHELTPDGFPWFGDGVELLINASDPISAQGASGTGRSWQMVCSTHKSRLGGVGVPGLLEGEPRTVPAAWAAYQRWIVDGAQRAVVRIKADKTGYVIEWAVRFNPCIELSPGVWYDGRSEAGVGLNIAVQDLDRMEDGEGMFANIHHESWWSHGTARAGQRPDERDSWGTLRLMPGVRPKR